MKEMTDQVISGCLRDHHNSETFAMYCEDCKLRKDPERCASFRENSNRVQFSLVPPLADLEETEKPGNDWAGAPRTL